MSIIRQRGALTVLGNDPNDECNAATTRPHSEDNKHKNPDSPRKGPQGLHPSAPPHG